jgi:putative tryptophan/tyrosine transport system substrate-binding protein
MAAEDRALPVSRRQLVQGMGIVGLGLLAGCGRLPGLAPPPPTVYRIGYLTSSSAVVDAPRLEALRRGLRPFGWIEDQNIVIEGRWADGQMARLPDLAAQLAQLRPDVIVTFSDLPSRAVKDATGRIPIVFAAHADPVGTGLVASFAHPGGNVTGVSNMAPQLAGKRLELLAQAVPTVMRVGAVYNMGDPAMTNSYGRTLAGAHALGIELLSLGVRAPDDLDGAYQAALDARIDAVVVITDPLLSRSRDRLVELSTKSGLPTISGDSTFAAAGGLMSYGPNLERQLERAAYYVDRILRGAQPADLPVEQPMTFDFVINLRTAQALGLTIPQHVLLQATEVIQ